MGNLGEIAKKRMGQLGIKQKELADAVGVTPAQISRIFKGSRGTTKNVLTAIADYIKLPRKEIYEAADWIEVENRNFSPKKRKLINLAEQSDDEAAVSAAIAVLEDAWERKKRK